MSEEKTHYRAAREPLGITNGLEAVRTGSFFIVNSFNYFIHEKTNENNSHLVLENGFYSAILINVVK